MTDLLERVVDMTRHLMAFPGSRSRPEARRACIDWVQQFLDPLPGIEIRTFEEEGVQSLVATPEDHPVPEILFLGHLDVVDHPEEGLYRSRVEDGCIVGPGSGDMKGAVAIVLELFRQVHIRRPGASLGLALTSDEETGGQHGVRHLFQDQGIRCGIALIPDGGAPNRVTVEEKGLIHIRVSTRGQAAHAARPWLGVNALEQLMDGLARARILFEALAIDPRRWHPTLTVTKVTTENRTINCVPARAEATLDVRYPSPFTVDGLLEEMRTVLGPDIRLQVLISSTPSRFEPDPLFLHITEEITGSPVELERSDGSSDARYIHDHGIPVLLSRPLVGNIHAEDEWVNIQSMGEFYRIYERYVAERLGLT